MKKVIMVATIIIAIIVIIFVGVKSLFINKNKNVNIDIQKLVEDLISMPLFEDDLSKIDRESIIKQYSLDNEKIKQINSYVGTGATSEEILIIELMDKNDINETKKIIKKKIEERKANFLNYLPKEVYKLENYNIEDKGNYIILCISNNYDKAKEVIKKYIN